MGLCLALHQPLVLVITQRGENQILPCQLCANIKKAGQMSATFMAKMLTQIRKHSCNKVN